MTSRDPTVRYLAKEKTKAEAASIRSVFRLFQQVIETISEDTGATKKEIVSNIKNRMDIEVAEKRLKHCKHLTRQGQTARQFQDHAAELWATSITNLPEHIFKFALNAVTDTLPHNAYLHLWAKQSSPVCKLCPER